MPEPVRVHGNILQAVAVPDTIQNVSYTDTAAASSAFGANVTILRLCATTDCYYLVGANPTATTSNGSLLPAGVVEHVVVVAGQKISAIQSSANGSLNVGEIAVGT